MPLEEEMFAWKLDGEGGDTRKERGFQSEGKASTTNKERESLNGQGT